MSAIEDEPQPVLRLVGCADCEQLRHALDAASVEIENQTVAIRSRDLEIGRLKADKAARRRNDPNWPIAFALFKFWQVRCNHPKAKFGPGRQKPLLARLGEGYTARQVAEGIVGAQRAAYVDERGHKNDDLEQICRTEVHLDRNIARYHETKG